MKTLIPLFYCAILVLCGCQSVDLESLGLESGGEGPPAVVPPVEAKPVSRTLPKSRTSNSSVQVGDTLEFFVKEDNSFNGEYKVREGGDVILPSVGRIPVKGLSVTAAGKKVEAALEKNLLKEATVIADRTQRVKVENSGTGRSSGPQSSTRKVMVYITGKVNRPGQHKLTIPDNRSLGVYEAILIAGGITRFGDEQKVHVLRTGADGKKHRIPVNIRLISNGKAKDPAIGEGDIVVVPEKVFGF